MDSRAKVVTQGGAHCNIRSLFRHMCLPRSKYKILVIKLQYMVDLAVFVPIQEYALPKCYTCFSTSTYVEIMI